MSDDAELAIRLYYQSMMLKGLLKFNQCRLLFACLLQWENFSGSGQENSCMVWNFLAQVRATMGLPRKPVAHQVALTELSW